jgi:hypothetical protein
MAQFACVRSPGNADELLDEGEEQLNKARDELMALAEVKDEN